MVNWKTYKITSKNVSSSYVLFYLDNYVNYNNGSNNYKHIFCSNSSPFCNWRENEFIEIDNDATRYRASGYYFNNTNEVRIDCRYSCGHSHGDYDALKERHSALERERNDLRTDRDSLRNDRDQWIRKYEELRKQSSDELNAEKLRNANVMASEKLSRQNTESTLRNEKTVSEEKLESSKNRELGLTRQLEDTKRERDQKIDELKEIEESLKILRIDYEKGKVEKDAEVSKRDIELRRKDEEIKNLLSQKGLSQEELLIEKLRSEKVNLESFATELKVDLEKTQSLIRDHNQLFQVQKSCDQTNIATHEDNIARTKRGLQDSGVGIITIQEVCRKCERIAELSWELIQIKQTQPTDAQQEKDWKNINSNFTPELVQAWIKCGFTYEQCQEWINVNSPEKQNRAIKEPTYYAWLRDIKRVNAEWVLNHGNEQELNQEFFHRYQEQYQAQEEIPTNH